MFSFALEFDREADLERALRLLERQDVTGEFHIQPLENGRGWRLTVWSERKIGNKTIERLRGRRVEVDNTSTAVDGQ